MARSRAHASARCRKVCCVAIVSAVVIVPLLAIFWISFKPIGLADLRPPAPVVRESLRGSDDDMRIQYRVRNSSRSEVITGVTLRDTLPDSLPGRLRILSPFDPALRDRTRAEPRHKSHDLRQDFAFV